MRFFAAQAAAVLTASQFGYNQRLKLHQQASKGRAQILIADIQLAREQQHGQRRCGCNLSQLRGHERCDPVEGVISPSQCPLPFHSQFPGHMIRHGKPHRGLCREMPEQGSLTYAHRRRRSACRHPVRSDLVGQVEDGRDDFGLAQFRGFSHKVPSK